MTKIETERIKERKLAAVIFIDLKDFSKRMHEDETTTLKLLKKYDSFVSLGVRVYKGNIIKMVGDGFLIEFSSSINALQFAMALQKTSHEYNEDKEENEKLLMRIGIHSGDIVVMEDGDIMGDAINVASRIQGFAQPNTICISSEVKRHVQGKLQVSPVSLGVKELKNISEPEEIFNIPYQEIKSFSNALPSNIPFPRRSHIRLAKYLLSVMVFLFVGHLAWKKWIADNEEAVIMRAAAKSGVPITIIDSTTKGSFSRLVAKSGEIKGDTVVVSVQYLKNGKVISEKMEKVLLK